MQISKNHRNARNKVSEAKGAIITYEGIVDFAARKGTTVVTPKAIFEAMPEAFSARPIELEKDGVTSKPLVGNFLSGHSSLLTKEEKSAIKKVCLQLLRGMLACGRCRR